MVTLGFLVSGCAAQSEEWDPRFPSAPAGWSPAPGAAQGAPYQLGRASYYSDRLAGHRTANGEPYEPGGLTCAHRTLPFGSFVDVARPDGRHVVVRVNDRGPYAAGRIVDLSRRAAAELGMMSAGVVDVALRVLSVPPARPR